MDKQTMKEEINRALEIVRGILEDDLPEELDSELRDARNALSYALLELEAEG